MDFSEEVVLRIPRWTKFGNSVLVSVAARNDKERCVVGLVGLVDLMPLVGLVDVVSCCRSVIGVKAILAAINGET